MSSAGDDAKEKVKPTERERGRREKRSKSHARRVLERKGAYKLGDCCASLAPGRIEEVEGRRIEEAVRSEKRTSG